MKRLFIVWILTCYSFIAYCQSSNEVVVIDGVHITFPIKPFFELKQSKPTYVSQSKNCIFQSIVQNNIIPGRKYEEFLNMSFNNQEKIISVLLDNIIKGHLAYTNSQGEVDKLMFGKYQGRFLSYNVANRNYEKRFLKTYFIQNNVITFTCYYKIDNEISKKEMLTFFNSIKIQ